ncbi:alanine racemase, partial [Streptococcus pyogenes]
LKGLRLHIKVDTGMGRIGFRTSQATNLAIANLLANEARVEGIFTHFASADQADESQFLEQLSCFKRITSELDYLPSLVHASNSATSIWHADTVFNMVRLGDILYGLNPSGRDLELP